MKHSILCVDDEPDNVDALERLFRRKYRVLKAHSGPEALKILKGESIALIISDQRMPEMTGVEFLAQSMDQQPDAIRFLLTGYTDIESVIEAVNSGQIYRYLTKPWDPVDLINTVDKAIERFELNQELKDKNVALQTALEELKTLDAAKNQFMVLINHELKTPLTVITSFLALLKETNTDEEQQKYIQRIGTSSDRLLELINDVLELVSAEAGVLPVAFERENLESIFQQVIDSHKDKALSKSQTMVADVQQPLVRADHKILFKVMNRLLDNAIKFAPEKSEIRVVSEKTSSKKVTVSVINDGKEIAPEVIQKIMKPFTLDEDMMNHSKGFGLGLSLTQALLKRISSCLRITSENQKVIVSFDLELL